MHASIVFLLAVFLGMCNRNAVRWKGEITSNGIMPEASVDVQMARQESISGVRLISLYGAHVLLQNEFQILDYIAFLKILLEKSVPIQA